MENRVLKYIVSVVLLFTVVFGVSAQVEVPKAPNPPRLVNDFAGLFTPEQTKMLEDSLSLFAQKTSNQIVVVTMNDLGEYTPNQMATEIGHTWGVGKAEYDNGLVMLIKPKNSTKGEVYLATGYGLEGVLPDGFCGEIIRNELIPQFKVNNYFAGVRDALRVILPVAAKEYSYEDYQKDHEDPWYVTLGAILVFIGIFYIAFFLPKKGRRGSSGSATALFLGSMLSSGGSHSSGGSSFGGFGGGGFGGGGAGGSW